MREKLIFVIYLVFLLTVGLLVALVLLFVIFFVFGIFGRKDVYKDDEMKTTKYQYYQFNPRTNDSNAGFVDLFESIDEDGYLTFQEGESHVLVTNSGSPDLEKYRCTGSCFCDDFRRNALTLTELSLFTLVAAFTSAIAVHFASNKFEEECHTLLIDECQKPNIRSEVDECSVSMSESFFKMEAKVSEDKPSEEEEEDFETTGYFQCTGNCITISVASIIADMEEQFGQKVPTESADKLQAALFDAFGCEKLSLTKEVSLFWEVPIRDPERGIKEFSEMEHAKSVSTAPIPENAAMKFIVETLEPFCTTESFQENMQLPLCRAISSVLQGKTPEEAEQIQVNSKVLNPSVKCVTKRIEHVYADGKQTVYSESGSFTKPE